MGEPGDLPEAALDCQAERMDAPPARFAELAGGEGERDLADHAEQRFRGARRGWTEEPGALRPARRTAIGLEPLAKK